MLYTKNEIFWQAFLFLKRQNLEAIKIDETIVVQNRRDYWKRKLELMDSKS
jgi:hypothetical protein